MVIFHARNTNIYKIWNFTELYSPYFTTIRKFIHFKMLFPAMVVDFVLVWIRISSIAGPGIIQHTRLNISFES